jgi:UDPglucose 6-dehydrogenase
MISILGLGFVGLTTGLGFAKKGFKTYGFDISGERLNSLKN